MDTILLINDSTALTKILSSHFRKAGYQVFAVTSAVEAYEAFIRHPVHLILTDYVLKDKDAISVVKTFRSGVTGRGLPIVVFTAIEDESIKQACRDAGADLVLPKTNDTDGMLKKIEALIDDYKANLPSRSIDTDMGHCIVKATTDVFKTMMQMKVVPGEIAVEKARPRKAEVIGSIGVAGFLSGSISVFLSRRVACEAAAKMLMLESPDAIGNDDLVDAIGELTNMIGGSIKTELFKKAPLFDISVPSVYVGQDLQRRTISDDLCFLVPFTYEGHELSVEFLMITKDSSGTTGVQRSLVDSMKS